MKFLEHPGDGRTVTNYSPGDVVFAQGTPAEHVFYLQSGRAKEVVRSDHGREAVVGIIETGLFFGTSAMDGHPLRGSTVVAVAPCVITAITREAMQRALQEPYFVKLFVSYLLLHTSKTEAEKVDLLFNSTEKRLAQRLLQLAEVGKGEPKIIGPEITQEMLARMIGTTRPHVNRFLMKFRRLGFVTYDGGIQVQPTLLQAVLQENTSRDVDKEEP